MKNLLSIVLMLALVMGVTTSTFAQSKEDKKKEKAEKKEWKKKAKSYSKSPLSLRDDLNGKDEQISKLTKELNDLKKRLSNCNSKVDSLQEIVNKKSAELAALETKYQKLQAAYDAEKNKVEKDIDQGLVYKVQVGAFVHFDINKYLKDTGENFEGETADGMNKYTMGKFKDYTLAEAFMKDIKKMGIKDAWVVPLIDGKRVTHEEAKAYTAKGGK
jgi:TolA-binding protein